MKEYILKNTIDKMRYHDFDGKGLPILFIHGLGCAGSFDYPNVATQHELLENRRILVDLLGSGYSDKPIAFDYSVKSHATYLYDFVNELGLEKFVLFGHSFGGSVALSLAELCKDKVSGVILSEANLDSGGGFTSKGIASFEMNDFIVEGFDKIVSESRASLNEMWAASLSIWLPQAAYLVSKSLINGQTPSWREIFYSLGCSKTFIYGDKSLPDSDMEILIDNGICIEIVENAGHSMAWENPKGLAEAIKNGIERCAK